MTKSFSSFLPLCIDLDGTLIRTDTLQEMIFQYIWNWPHKCINILLWLCKGRAFLKQQLAFYIQLPWKDIPVNEIFLNWLYQEKNKGRTLILVTASDQASATSIARHIKIFDEVLASNGQINLRADEKAKALVQKFGEKKFAYAGNSKDDLKVWAKAGEIIAVNTPKRVLEKAKLFQEPMQVFEEGLKPTLILKGLFNSEVFSAIVPIILSYLISKHSFIQHVSFFISTLSLGIAMTLLGCLLRMRSKISKLFSNPFIDAIQTGAVPIPLVNYTLLLMGITGIIGLTYLPLYACMSICLVSFIWLILQTYPPLSKGIRLSIKGVLLVELFCAALTFLNY